LPAPPGHGADGAFSAWGACPYPRQAGRRGRFIEKDEALRGDGGEFLPPRGPRRRVALGGDQGLFLSGKPSRAKARDMVAVLTVTPWVVAQAAQCSASVASG
jgi:hypothetical protein